MKSLVMEIQKLHDEACSGGDQRQKIFKFQHTEKKEKKWQFDDRAIMKGLFVSTASVCGYVFNTYQISKDG